jgi:FKBP-type peptidyl-prolyl cis-trans isomerase SlyD
MNEMTVANNRVIEVEFRINDESGYLLETTDPDQPISFVQGSGSLLADIERALEGKGIGEEISLKLPPEKAFGYINAELNKVVSINELDLGDTPLEVGESIVLDEDGLITWTVYKVVGDEVYLDGNHPYSGKTLGFWVKVVGIKDSRKSEAAQAQGTDGNQSACGPGCCC